MNRIAGGIAAVVFAYALIALLLGVGILIVLALR